MLVASANKLYAYGMSITGLTHHRALKLKQRFEGAELFGLETRNRFDVFSEGGDLIGHAEEQSQGVFGFILRQLFGHWRSFDILFFTPDRRLILRARHPFRFLFQRLDVFEGERHVGSLQQRFAIFRKRFDVLNERGQVVMAMSSPFFRLWTFPFQKAGRQVGQVAKRWSGIFTEWLTDKDAFLVEFADVTLSEDERRLILAAAVFIDLQYFEHKG